MKDKIDKYLELANEVHLANVPLDKPSAESLLRESGRGTAQNFVNRFINFFGRHLFMTITSIIAVIFSGLYLLSTFGVTENFPEKNDANLLARSNSSTNLDFEKSKSISDDLKLSDDEHTTKDSTNSESPNQPNEPEVILNNLEDINWSWLIFNIENWGFMWTFRIEKYSTYDKNGNNQISQRISSLHLEDKYLIKVSKQLEDSLRNTIDFNTIKKICFMEIPDYFDKLTEINNSISERNDNHQIINMINMYAHITRKLVNNPSEMMRIKSKGLILPKEILEKLDISFTDSTISIPHDELFTDKNILQRYLKLYKANNLNLDEIPEKEILLKKNLIFEWEKVEPKEKIKKVLWRYSQSSGYFRPENGMSSGSIDEFESKPKEIRGVFSQYYYHVNGIESSDNFNKKAPLLFIKWSMFNYHDATLYFSNENTKKVYEISEKISRIYTLIGDYNENTLLSNSEKDKLLNDISRQEIIQSNIQNSVKYRYLIPVDIQIPYYGFTKDELDTMPNATFVTLWYYPNEEFLSALPDDIRKQLEKEMKLVESVQKGEMQPEDACEEVKDSKSLLGLCNLTVQAIANLNLYPNPALDYINVKFDLLDTRFYKIILTDATGQYIKDLSDWTESGKSEVKVIVPTNGLQNGAYIIHVVTEKSEKLMSKFVVRK